MVLLLSRELLAISVYGFVIDSNMQYGFTTMRVIVVNYTKNTVLNDFILSAFDILFSDTI